MDSNSNINKPIYKYKPISYYSNSSRKNSTEIEEKEEEEFDYVIDENKLKKLRALKEEKEKEKKINQSENENNKDVKKNINQSKKKSVNKSNKEKNKINKTNESQKMNTLINSNKDNIINNNENIIKDNENIPKSNSVFSLNTPKFSEFEINERNNNFALDSNKDNKKDNGKKIKNKSSKKKIKKIIKIKKKNTKDLTNKSETIKNFENKINNKVVNSKLKEKDYKNEINFIIKIQDMWKSYKSKRKLKLILFINKLFKNIIKANNDYIKNFFSNLKSKIEEKTKFVNIEQYKLNKLLEKEKNYNILDNKYKEVLKELNEIKNQIIFKQNFNMINNKNQNISINIFPKKENKNKNNFRIDKKNDIKIIKDKNNINNEKIFSIYNLFYFLINLKKFQLKYYLKRFMLYLNICNNQKSIEANQNNNINSNSLIINKIKSFSLIKDEDMCEKIRFNKKFEDNLVISSQLSNLIIPYNNQNKIFENLNISKQSLIISENNSKKNRFYISDKNEIFIKKEKSKKCIKKCIINKIIKFEIVKKESFIEDNMFNYIKNNKFILEKIKKIFDLKTNIFNENELFINKICQIKFHKNKKIENIISKSQRNNFTIKNIPKKENNYIITKIQDKFRINSTKNKLNDFIITKNIQNFKIKGIDYSENIIDIYLFISDTYKLTINSSKKNDKSKNFQISKPINEFIIDKKKEKNNHIKYIFDDNKLIINKIIKNMRITKMKKDDFVINKCSSKSLIIRNKNWNDKNIITKIMNNFYFQGNCKTKNNDFVINRIYSFCNIKNIVVNENNYIINKIVSNINFKGSVNYCNNLENKFKIKYKENSLVITKCSNEFFMKIQKRKKKVKKSKKSKRFKTKLLFISDKNELFFKKTNENCNKILGEIEDDNNIIDE